MIQKPTIGRIVHVNVERGASTETYAALITHVWNDTCVNLKVFGKDDRDEDFNLSSSKQGDEPLQWSWPVIK